MPPKEVTFLTDPDLIEEYLSEEGLMEMDLYIFQLLNDGVVKKANPYPEEKEIQYYEFSKDYIGLFDGKLILYLGSTSLPEIILECEDDSYSSDQPITIIKIESYYHKNPNFGDN